MRKLLIVFTCLFLFSCSYSDRTYTVYYNNGDTENITVRVREDQTGLYLTNGCVKGMGETWRCGVRKLELISIK